MMLIDSPGVVSCSNFIDPIVVSVTIFGLYLGCNFDEDPVADPDI